MVVYIPMRRTKSKSHWSATANLEHDKYASYRQPSKIHSPHAFRSPTQRTNFRGVSPYASHPTPSEEATGPLTITEEAQCWKQLPLICKNHGCSSNTGGLGVHLQKTAHDEHYSRLKDYVNTNSEPKLSRTKDTP